MNFSKEKSEKKSKYAYFLQENKGKVHLSGHRITYFPHPYTFVWFLLRFIYKADIFVPRNDLGIQAGRNRIHKRNTIQTCKRSDNHWPVTVLVQYVSICHPARGTPTTRTSRIHDTRLNTCRLLSFKVHGVSFKFHFGHK